MKSVLTVIRHSDEPTEKANEKQSLAISSETFWKIRSVDKSGNVLTLYLFYVQKCIDQNSSQPLATDDYCTNRLNISINTIRKCRKLLQNIGLVELIRKRRHNYIRVNYLPFRIEGPSLNLSTDTIPSALLGTYVVFDYFQVWNRNIVAKPAPFINKVNRSAGESYNENDVLAALAFVLDDKIDLKGYGIDKIDTELRYYHYLVACVVNKLKTQMVCA